MEFFGTSAPQHLDAFVTSLGIGLLLGLERERRTDPAGPDRDLAWACRLSLECSTRTPR